MPAALDENLTSAIPRRLYKGVELKIARVVFFRALDPVHNFAVRQFNDTRVTFFVLSFARRSGRQLSGLQHHFLDALLEKKTSPYDFGAREACIRLWVTSPGDLPKWSSSELRQYKALSSQMGKQVKIAQKALEMMGEEEEDDDVKSEGEEETVGREASGGVATEQDLVDLFQYAMSGVQRAMKADVSLEERMEMLSLLQGTGINLTSQWASIAAGASGDRGRSHYDDVDMGEGE